MKRALPSTCTRSGDAAPLRRAPPTAANTVDSSASAVAFSPRLLLQWFEERVGCASKCVAAVSEWNREGEGGGVCDVFDVNSGRNVACGRMVVPPHASQWQPLTTGWQPPCGRTHSHTAHETRPTWRRKPACLLQDSCVPKPTKMLACGRGGELPHVWALTFPFFFLQATISLAYITWG